MPARPPRPDDSELDRVERHLAHGDWQNALATLLPELDARPDRAALLAARLLRAQDTAPATPDALAFALDRLVHVVERQEAQLRALQSMVEETL